MVFQRREIPWEVVDSRTVDPIPLYLENKDLGLVVVKQRTVRRKYVLDVKPLKMELRNALIFSQGQLLHEIQTNGYNVLLSESWQVTLLRRGTLYRIEVEYTGRPARASNEKPHPHPPYMAVLEDVAIQASEPTTHIAKNAGRRLIQPRLGRPISFLINRRN